jgi:hypothetical protein
VKRRAPLILASNVLFLLLIPLVVLWPVTGRPEFGVLALVALLLSASLAGAHASGRSRRQRGTP